MKKRPSRKPVQIDAVPFQFKKQFLPPLLGVLTTFLIIGLFNASFAANFYNPVVQANAQELDQQFESKAVEADKSAPARIYINKVGIEAPIDFTQTSNDETDFQVALRDGVVHYPGTAVPGEIGNVAIFGHSSGSIWSKGSYKFIFAPLHELALSDKIYIEYQGTRYIYTVSHIKKVKPEDVSVLSQTNTRKLTLITCTPIGTNKERLIIEADQVFPVYSAKELIGPKNTSAIGEIEALPGKTPSTWQNITSIFER